MLLEQQQELQEDPHQVGLPVAGAVLVEELHQEILKALGDVNLEKSIYRHG
jgi:hypothetical protein